MGPRRSPGLFILCSERATATNQNATKALGRKVSQSDEPPNQNNTNYKLPLTNHTPYEAPPLPAGRQGLLITGLPLTIYVLRLTNHHLPTTLSYEAPLITDY